MQSISLITRNGIISTNKSTSNQCGSVGVYIYEYELKILFSNKAKLDKNGFLIDHQDIDDAVKKVKIGSCEEMAERILSEIEKLLNSKEIPFFGLKVKIQPLLRAEKNSAFFQMFRAHNQKLNLVMNL